MRERKSRWHYWEHSNYWKGNSGHSHSHAVAMSGLDMRERKLRWRYWEHSNYWKRNSGHSVCSHAQSWKEAKLANKALHTCAIPCTSFAASRDKFDLKVSLDLAPYILAQFLATWASSLPGTSKKYSLLGVFSHGYFALLSCLSWQCARLEAFGMMNK